MGLAEKARDTASVPRKMQPLSFRKWLACGGDLNVVDDTG